MRRAVRCVARRAAFAHPRVGTFFGSERVISFAHEVRAATATAGVNVKTASLNALDARLALVFQALIGCVRRFGAAHVLIDDEIDKVVAPPPRVHVDPAGRRFVFDANTGCVCVCVCLFSAPPT